MTDDRHDLARFVAAQAAVFDTALAELTAGRKRSHWMWFVFPQHRELGRSPTARAYGIGSLAEARAYMAHRLLGPRLVVATKAVLGATAPSLHAIFGSPDDLKFRSSMTLFERAASDEPVFAHAIAHWCGGERDPLTLALIDSETTRS